MCIKYLNSTCFDVDIDDNTFSLYIRSGAFVLLAYVCSHWLHHIDKVERHDLKTLTSDIECFVGKRVNLSFTNEPIVCGSDAECSKSLSFIGEQIGRLHGYAHAFSKKRKRDLSFDDGKRVSPVIIPKYFVLTHINVIGQMKTGTAWTPSHLPRLNEGSTTHSNRCFVA